jgi:hypothetical protein
LASFPEGEDGVRLPGGKPSLSLAGSLDCSAKLEEVREGAATLPSPTAVVVLTGVTHYQFTATEQKDLERGCSPAVELEVAHDRIAEALGTFVTAALAGTGLGVESLAGQPGVEVESR